MHSFHFMNSIIARYHNWLMMIDIYNFVPKDFCEWG